MRYEEIRCRVCGSERLEKQNDGTYVCGHCRSRFCENDLEEYKKTIRSELRGAVTEALVCQRAQDIANIRQNLFKALQEEYTDSYKIVGYCRDLKKLLPNDFQANCFETLNNGGKKEVNAMLKSVDEKGAGRFYVKDILEFMVKSLMPANLLPLKSLADRALKDEEKTEYLNKIEEEAGKCEAGLYSPEVPRKAFIAYSSKDMAIVTPLVEYLENAGISCFVALRNIRHGRKAVENYDKILQRAMHNCKSFVLVSTRNSRRFDCDAIEKELPYVRDKEPNVKRIEYLVEDYGENEGAIKSTLKDFFGGSEWVRNLEDLPSRIMDIKPQAAAAPAVKYCLACGAENPVNVNFCGQCGKQEFGTKEEYEERQLERREAEQKETERKEAERKEAERREASQKKVEKKEDASAASKAEAKAVSVASSDPADFEIEDGVLKEYRGKGGDVVIPNGVTSIGDSAFEGCSSLTSITIPNSVASIGWSAFGDCSGLTRITIPNSVTSIEEGAFSGCSGLTSITIPKSVTSIEEGAFFGCSSLKSITIPKGVTSIADGAFCGCESLEEIKAKKGNPVYHSDGSCLIKTKSGELIAGCKNSRIPTDGSVTSIGEFAFAYCSGLTSITIPKSVTSIGEGAFMGCSGLTSIIIPSSVTSIETGAFSGCENLEDIKAEKGNPVYHSEGNCLIETDSEALVAGCKNSRIPTDGSVTWIGEEAFADCSSLSSIDIPNSVTSIGRMAFSGCSGLTSITIPNSVTSIGRAAFWGCSGLTSVTIPKSVTSIEERAFMGCSGLTRITIPDSVMSIEEGAFKGCSGLTSIAIPSSVTSIGRGAFDDCRKSLKIYCHDRKPLKWPEGWDVSLKDRIIWDE